MELKYKSVEYQVEDLSTKNEGATEGTVRFVASVAGNIDSGADLISSGEAYRKTVKSREDRQRLKHFREHNPTMLVGFPTLQVDGDKLWANSKLMLKREIGMDTYEMYKAASEAGRTIEHSIGYAARDYHYEEIKRMQVRVIDDLYIGEVSTLSAWGMNKMANEFDVKSMDVNKLLIEEKFMNNLLNAKFDDVKLEHIEEMKNLLEKEIKRRTSKDDNWLNHISL